LKTAILLGVYSRNQLETPEFTASWAVTWLLVIERILHKIIGEQEWSDIKDAEIVFGRFIHFMGRYYIKS
jgi:hypothetical protein